MTAASQVRIAPLSAYPQVMPLLRRWFKEEWPDYYGPGGEGDAAQDLRAFAGSGDELPFALVALRDGAVCGIAALKAESIASHAHLTPWAAAGLVEPGQRRVGIGALLLQGLADEARRRGHTFLYCGTSTSESLLQRQGWELLERVVHAGQPLGVYRKAL